MRSFVPRCGGRLTRRGDARRSVTMISAVQRDVCGLCVVVPGVVKKPRNFTNEVEVRSSISHLHHNVYSQQAESCWVECSTKTCHAQYVIEDIPALRVSFSPHLFSTTHRINNAATQLRSAPAATTAATTPPVPSSNARDALTG